MFGDRFCSSTSCSRWLHETEPCRLDQSLPCRFLKVATHPRGQVRTGPSPRRAGMMAGTVPDGWARQADVQRPRVFLDPRRFSLRVNEGHHYLGRRSSSACAKNAEAFRRISFARLSSRFSRSSVVSRSRSSVVRPGRRPVVTLRLAHPMAQRLGRAADLLGHRPNRRPLRLVLVLVVKHQPNRPFPYLR